LWQRHEEKKKEREMLILVRKELEINKKMFEHQAEVLRRDNNAYQKILKADRKWKTIPQDSLDFYVSFFWQYDYPPLMTSSWQVFQNSEVIQKMSNKELIVRLTDCYYSVAMLHDHLVKNYWDQKQKLNITYDYDGLFLDAVMDNRELVNFLRYLHDWNLFENIDYVSVEIDYALSLLDKYGNFRYDMDREAEEYRSFIKAGLDSIRQKRSAI